MKFNRNYHQIQQASSSSSLRKRIYVVILVITIIIFILNILTHNKNSSIIIPDKAKQLIKYDTIDKKIKESLEPVPPLVLWSSDFHVATIADIKHFLSNKNVKIIDKSLSYHCHLTDTCEKDLRIINRYNGIKLEPCPNKLREEFFLSYRCDSTFASVDAFIITHANSMSELFLPFNTSIIVIATTRYEQGRHEAKRWFEFNQNLRHIASSPYNVIAANNRYDQEYVKYFTGISDVLLLPSYCGYVTARYNPVNTQFLLAPARGVNSKIASDLQKHVQLYNSNLCSGCKVIDIVPIRELYPYFKYEDIAAHPAIVIIPYQISFMSFFEFYRMEIPMFVPSPELLTEWHLSISAISERTWATVLGWPVGQSAISRHPNSTSKLLSDPNNEYGREAILEWVKLGDFYTADHVTTFSNWDELFNLLQKTNLNDVSKHMKEYSNNVLKDLEQKWDYILDKVRQGVKTKRFGDGNRFYEKSKNMTYIDNYCKMPTTINDALFNATGLILKNRCTGNKRKKEY